MASLSRTRLSFTLEQSERRAVATPCVDRGLFRVREDPLHVSGLVEGAGILQDRPHVELPKRLVVHPRVNSLFSRSSFRLVHGIRQRADVGHDLPDRAIRQPAAALFEVIELLRGQRVNLAVGVCLFRSS